MIPLRYREMLPPYMYEIDMAERHFGVMELEINDRGSTIDDLSNQFLLQRATWALPLWEWMYLRGEQIGTYEQRRELVRRKKLSKLPFTRTTLRALGARYGKLIDLREDFAAQTITFVYSIDSVLDFARLYADFEYIRPVHINRAVPAIRTDFRHIYSQCYWVHLRSRVRYFGGRPWYLDGVQLLDGMASLSGWTGERQRNRQRLEIRTSHRIPNKQDGVVKARQNYWLLDGSVQLDGSRLLSSQEKIIEV
ncbi:putative phage tail protein [Paenibacillus macerans]|uniref:putative phage tail protein n=1 Tax=Paenibacillus macerans TaxID=44252 RepID=UPI002040A306|nr:putative phage tail protein [Paenibacillus macerans]MCM3699183.1 YmfQ family protein [Paenibacillus macerans]